MRRPSTQGFAGRGQAGLWPTRGPSAAQGNLMDQLGTHPAPGLVVDSLIDRLVGHPLLRLVRELTPQPALDLTGRPPLIQFLANQRPQPALVDRTATAMVPDQLPGPIPQRPTLRLLLGTASRIRPPVHATQPGPVRPRPARMPDPFLLRQMRPPIGMVPISGNSNPCPNNTSIRVRSSNVNRFPGIQRILSIETFVATTT